MARVAGVDIPENKKVWASLTYIYGIGPSLAREILTKANVSAETRTKDLKEEELARIRDVLEKGYRVEGELRRVVGQNIKRLEDIGSYRGLRHKKRLPVRGQRTRSNARTRKGKRKTIAGKKEVAAKK